MVVTDILLVVVLVDVAEVVTIDGVDIEEGDADGDATILREVSAVGSLAVALDSTVVIGAIDVAVEANVDRPSF